MNMDNVEPTVTKPVDTDGDENEERGNWNNKVEGFLSVLGFNIGLENVWRFPYVCYRNGGAVFLVPYTIMLIVLAIPLTFIELSIGQFSSSGVITCWEMVPLFRGIGVSMMLVIGMIAVYYNMIIGYGLFYIVSSFTANVPWGRCDAEWSTEDCEARLVEINCTDMILHTNGTCYNGTEYIGVGDMSLFTNVTGRKPVAASEEYFYNSLLHFGGSDGIGNIGPPQWHLVLCLLGSWTIVCLCMIKGIKSTGKAVYVTALFPYVFLVAMLIFALLQPGAQEGIYYYIQRAEWDRLTKPEIWKDAAGQIFFSTSVGAGGLLTLASYNKFNNNVLRDAILAPLGNCITSFVAGFVVFANLGVMAKQLGAQVDNVTTEGPGLIFVVYPNAFSLMPVTQLWAVLFFGMVITLGLDSVFGGIEMIVTGIVDHIPRSRPYKALVLIGVCVVGFLAGIAVTTPGGLYVIQLLDANVPIWGLMLNSLLTCFAVSWIYGTNRFLRDIRVMIGWPYTKCAWISWNIFWYFMWNFLCLAGIIFIFVFYILEYVPLNLDKVYVYPPWAQGIGWLTAMAPVAFIPIVAIAQFFQFKGSFLEKMKALIKPTAKWGPKLPRHRQLVTYVKNFDPDPYMKTSGRSTAKGLDNTTF
ncbi:unnamed protein product [Owenia fusiformis]|uniref:Transporter n=1 Tax=Owenia fusiformis TaxID=6347 RepID=A0A8S4NSW8_OWEFU|nr:unnamed protein product [Owenia fusiformis]